MITTYQLEINCYWRYTRLPENTHFHVKITKVAWEETSNCVAVQIKGIRPHQTLHAQLPIKVGTRHFTSLIAALDEYINNYKCFDLHPLTTHLLQDLLKHLTELQKQHNSRSNSETQAHSPSSAEVD